MSNRPRIPHNYKAFKRLTVQDLGLRVSVFGV